MFVILFSFALPSPRSTLPGAGPPGAAHAALPHAAAEEEHGEEHGAKDTDMEAVDEPAAVLDRAVDEEDDDRKLGADQEERNVDCDEVLTTRRATIHRRTRGE